MREDDGAAPAEEDADATLSFNRRRMSSDALDHDIVLSHFFRVTMLLLFVSDDDEGTAAAAAAASEATTGVLLIRRTPRFEVNASSV